MTRRLVILLLLGACSAQDNLSRWRGPVTPTTPGPACTASTGLLERHGTTYTFAPNEGTWILRGQAQPGTPITVSQTTIGADKKDYTTTFSGTQTAQGVSGTYTTPHCTFQATLPLVH